MAVMLDVKNINVYYGAIHAVKDISFQVNEGEIVTLIGANGAGKSTMMKMLAGVETPSSGQIILDGKAVSLQSTHQAEKLGISIIFQELNLFPNMNVMDNIFMANEFFQKGRINEKYQYALAKSLLERLELDVDPYAPLGELGIGHQQLVEIARALSKDTRVLIMDEPTSALTEGEVAHLFTIIRDLRAQGKAIIYIGHKMDAIFAITDEISVFRDGTWVGSKNTTEFTRQSLITQMVGRELTQLFPKFNNTIGEEVLTVRNLTRQGVFHDVSFSVRRGEILGVAGLVGAGRSEVMESLFGMERFDSGEVLIDGAPVTIDSPSVAIEKGMALLTEDRKKSGLFLVLSVLENMSIVKMPEYIGKSGFVQHVKMAEDCMEQIRRLNIKTPTMDQIINNLSGGNQQKVLIARWLLAQPKILILDEPTRGIDVGAKAEIYHLISELANRGVAVIMVSSELPEILGMSDRVMVMHEGRITGILEKDEADQETILSLASH